jgi:hypothetical protein
VSKAPEAQGLRFPRRRPGHHCGLSHGHGQRIRLDPFSFRLLRAPAIVIGLRGRTPEMEEVDEAMGITRSDITAVT